MSGIGTFDLYFGFSLTLQPKEYKRLYFNKTIVTSLPAQCILFGSPDLYLHGLSSSINIIKTNDSYPHIVIYNFTNKTLYIKPYTIHVLAKIVLTCNK
jgi:hypothetical protein